MVFLRVFRHTSTLPVIMDNLTLSFKVISFFWFVILSDRLEFSNKCYITVTILVYFYLILTEFPLEHGTGYWCRKDIFEPDLFLTFSLFSMFQLSWSFFSFTNSLNFFPSQDLFNLFFLLTHSTLIDPLDSD